MYQIEFGKQATKDLAGLERTQQIRLLAKLELAAKDPPRFFMPLKGVEGFRMRVGDLRILAEIETDPPTIIVAAIGKRAGIYEA